MELAMTEGEQGAPGGVGNGYRDTKGAVGRHGDLDVGAERVSVEDLRAGGRTRACETTEHSYGKGKECLPSAPSFNPMGSDGRVIWPQCSAAKPTSVGWATARAAASSKASIIVLQTTFSTIPVHCFHTCFLSIRKLLLMYVWNLVHLYGYKLYPCPTIFLNESTFSKPGQA